MKKIIFDKNKIVELYLEAINRNPFEKASHENDFIPGERFFWKICYSKKDQLVDQYFLEPLDSFYENHSYPKRFLQYDLLLVDNAIVVPGGSRKNKLKYSDLEKNRNYDFILTNLSDRFEFIKESYLEHLKIEVLWKQV